MTAIPNKVVIHPLVLLSVVDHFNRVVIKNRNKRVVGVLLGRTEYLKRLNRILPKSLFFPLGEFSKGSLDVTNCYAVPFEEDPKEQHIWFLDHMYHENMYSMFKKVDITLVR
jgi:hypothetical protein